MEEAQAEIVLTSSNLNGDLAFFENAGFKMISIYPAEKPAVARMTGHGLQIRLDSEAISPPPVINILTDNPEGFADDKRELVAPNGTILRIIPKTFRLKVPKTQHSFQVNKLIPQDGGTTWTTGRAGMLYRDLIPDRLGGAIIASHICIPNGGPVPDVVHFHTISFQLIYCYNGWVKLVYEDQGPPFVLEAGDCVTQPPEIRHRVLEASEDLQVIEVGVPMEHMTTVDHNLTLPTTSYKPNREYSGQTFCRHQSAKAKWIQAGYREGFEIRETGITEATKGLASVRFIRPINNAMTTNIKLSPMTHNSDIYFAFIVKGEVELEGHETQHHLTAGDSFAMPPGSMYKLGKWSDDLEFLEVILPREKINNEL